MASQRQFAIADPSTGKDIFFSGAKIPTQSDIANILNRVAAERKTEVRNPAKAAVLSASELIGGPFPVQYWVQRAKGISHAEAMLKAGEISEPLEKLKPKGIPAQLASGAVQAAPILAGAVKPFMAGAGILSKAPIVGKALSTGVAKSAVGFGAYEAAKAGVTGQISTPGQAVETFKEGAKSGALFHAGGRLGATATQPLRGLTKQASRIGSAVGAGTTAAALAPEGEKVSAGLIGGAFGAKFPAKPLGSKSPTQLRGKAKDIMREIIRPSQPEIRKLSKQGKKVDSLLELAVKENLEFTQTGGKENKLETTNARKQVQDKVSSMNEGLNKILQTNKNRIFDLESIRTAAHKKVNKKIKNSQDRIKARSEIDAEIDAEIAERGTSVVNASELNNIKQGMWNKAFNLNEPTAKKNARTIGQVAKERIERFFPEKNVKQINQQEGELLDLHELLFKAEGRVVESGRLGKMFGRGIGGAIGASAGAPLPFFGPIGGGIIGQEVGARTVRKMADPAVKSRKASRLSNKAAKLEKPGLLDRLAQKKVPITPEILPDRKTIPVSNQKFIEAKKILQIESKPIHSRTQDPNAIRLRNQNTGETIIVPKAKQKLIGFDPTKAPALGTARKVQGTTIGPKGRFGSPEFTVKNK